MKQNQKGFSAVEILIVIVVVGLLGTVGWLVYGRQKTAKKIDTTPSLSTSLKETPKAEPVTDKAVDRTPQVSAEINALINKGDYLGLANYMVDNLTVVKQSTDGNGEVTKNQAAKSISTYLTKSNASLGADLPWDFSGRQADREKINKSKGIISYYSAQGHFGISANNWVVAYNLNKDLKIDGFYMSVSLDAVE